ncbi:structural maintenance of chromosomes 2 [Actinidia rufa]|uniref:Structural maintenance of chromosomes 2 n=1 Tax=Actinidia rufa TaxID=165716 RepID=A0A7J0EQ57_9ERIC|nr:structural maintenance of chromosomes 2 [Actinidia rufa]
MSAFARHWVGYIDGRYSPREREQLKLQHTISEMNLERKKMENEVRWMEMEQKDCSLKVQKLIDKHTWITSQKQLFGRSGTDYDFASRDPRKSREDFEKLQAEQSGLLPGTMEKLEPLEESSFLDALEVRVAFGGIWKQFLSELSGGQISLLALSLILALLLFKPAPIYILDEFIVVSLKEGMFNNANVLFRTKFVDGVSTGQRMVASKLNKWLLWTSTDDGDSSSWCLQLAVLTLVRLYFVLKLPAGNRLPLGCIYVDCIGIFTPHVAICLVDYNSCYIAVTTFSFPDFKTLGAIFKVPYMYAYARKFDIKLELRRRVKAMCEVGAGRRGAGEGRLVVVGVGEGEGARVVEPGGGGGGGKEGGWVWDKEMGE